MGSAGCIAVSYKMISGSKKKKNFAKTQILVVCIISFDSALQSGFFLLNSSPTSCKKFVWGFTDEDVYHNKELDLQKGLYASQYFYQYPSHSVFVTQCSVIIAHVIHVV